MTPQTKIKAYLQQISKGMVNITDTQAAEIVKLAQPGITLQDTAGTAFVKFFKYDATNSKWELHRIIATTDEMINTSILQALSIGPVDGFYKYELYNSDGNFEGNILTANANLF